MRRLWLACAGALWALTAQAQIVLPGGGGSGGVSNPFTLGTQASSQGVLTLAAGASGQTTGSLIFNWPAAGNSFPIELRLGTWAAGNPPVAFFRPNKATTVGQTGLAFDLMPNTNPADVWQDICGFDVVSDPSNWECLDLKFSHGSNYAHVGTTASGTGVIRPLAIQQFGGFTSFGALIPTIEVDLISTYRLGWDSGSGTSDTAFARNAAGVVEVNNGTRGTLRDLTLRNLKTQTTQPGILYSAAGTALPACAAGTNGNRAIVSDATIPTYHGAYTSGGAVVSGVICVNGAGWLTD